jgi:mRNA interferase MazF
MLLMTAYNPGDVVLVNFVFSDESGLKQRPALILSTDRYHRSRQEAIVAAITSNVTRLLAGDVRVRAWREAGLLYPSVVTGIIRTVKQDMISRKLGTLSENDLQTVKRKLREILVL